jgi:hypothetical protein
MWIAWGPLKASFFLIALRLARIAPVSALEMIGGTVLQFSRNCFTCSFGSIPNSSVSLPSGALAVNFGTSFVAVLLILSSAKKEFSFLIWSLVSAILPPYVSPVLCRTKPTIAGKKHKINRQVRRIGMSEACPVTGNLGMPVVRVAG